MPSSQSTVKRQPNIKLIKDCINKSEVEIREFFQDNKIIPDLRILSPGQQIEERKDD
jgi:hypothetical protein